MTERGKANLIDIRPSGWLYDTQGLMRVPSGRDRRRRQHQAVALSVPQEIR